MNPIIEFCMNNLASGSQKAFEQLDKDPDLDVIEDFCLGNCTQCARGHYALVEGEYVSGETPEALVKNIYKHLEENPMF
ncbi:MAG TPA: YuzB family protein [Bacillales bacterium]|nr:YuzB family protein [Bacillales bacterium]